MRSPQKGSRHQQCLSWELLILPRIWYLCIQNDDNRTISRHKHGTSCGRTRIEVPAPTRSQLSHTLHLHRPGVGRSGSCDRLRGHQGSPMPMDRRALGSQDDALRPRPSVREHTAACPGRRRAGAIQPHGRAYRSLPRRGSCPPTTKGDRSFTHQLSRGGDSEVQCDLLAITQQTNTNNPISL